MDESGPVEADGHGVYPSSGLFTSPTRTHTANGDHAAHRTDGISDGNIIFSATRAAGCFAVNWSNPESILKEKIDDDEIGSTRAAITSATGSSASRHAASGFDLAIGHKTNNLCNIGNIVMQPARR